MTGQHLKTGELYQCITGNKIYLLRHDMVANFIHVSESKIILMELTLKQLRYQPRRFKYLHECEEKIIFQKNINNKNNYFTCLL